MQGETISNMKSTQIIIETSHPFNLLLEVDQIIW